MQTILTILLFCATLFSVPLMAATILTCKATDGKTIYTDDARKCGTQKAAEVHLDIPKGTRVNYRYPERQYDAVPSRWPIFIERPEKEADRKVYEKAIKRLEKTLDLVFSKFPLPSHAKLKSVTFYIMRGPKSTLGGENSVLRYFAHNSAEPYSLHDKRWRNAVVIYNVDNFLYQSDLSNSMTIVHELAHAWHFLHWTYQYQPIVDAWLNSRNSGLYQSVKDKYGRTLKPAYASTNEMEYFADLSAMYFVGGTYYPFDKQGLLKYDPRGHQMIEAYWLTQKTNP